MKKKQLDVGSIITTATAGFQVMLIERMPTAAIATGEPVNLRIPLSVYVPPISILGPSEIVDEKMLARWVWENRREEVLKSIRVSVGNNNKELAGSELSRGLDANQLLRKTKLLNAQLVAAQDCLLNRPQPEVLSKFVKEILDMMECEIGLIGTLQEHAGSFVATTLASAGFSGSTQPPSITLEGSSCGEFVREKRAIVDDNCLRLPIVIDGKVAGLVALGSRPERPFTQIDANFLSNIGQTCGSIIRAYEDKQAADVNLNRTQVRVRQP